MAKGFNMPAYEFGDTVKYQKSVAFNNRTDAEKNGVVYETFEGVVVEVLSDNRYKIQAADPEGALTTFMRHASVAKSK